MVTVLKSGDYCNFEQFSERLEHLNQWSMFRALCGLGRCIEYEQLRKVSNMPNKVEICQILGSISYHLQDWNYMSYQHAVSKLERALTSSDNLAPDYPAILEFIRYALGISLPELMSSREISRYLREYGEQIMQGKSRQTSEQPDIVEQVVQYIETHYMNDVGIGQLADQFHVTANYLSALFRKRTGVNFVKYLTRIRMYKAKELLLNTNLQVRQIAEEVGYYSTRHFTKLFTQTFGCYPSDYRKERVKSAKLSTLTT